MLSKKGFFIILSAYSSFLQSSSERANQICVRYGDGWREGERERGREQVMDYMGDMCGKGRLVFGWCCATYTRKGGLPGRRVHEGEREGGMLNDDPATTRYGRKNAKKACCIYHTETGGKILPLLQLTFPHLHTYPSRQKASNFPIAPPPPESSFCLTFWAKAKALLPPGLRTERALDSRRGTTV